MTPPQHAIGLSGVDGTGKSALAAALAEEREIFASPPVVRWMRYNHYLTRLVNLCGRFCGLSYTESHADGTVVGYHDYQKSRLLSVLLIVATFLDTTYAWIMKVWIPRLVSRQTALFDRGVPDVIVDLTIDTGYEQFLFGPGGRYLFSLVPQEVTLCILMAPQDVVAARRPDTAHDRHFAHRLTLYEKLLKTYPSLIRIDTDTALETSVEQLKLALQQKYHVTESTTTSECIQ